MRTLDLESTHSPPINRRPGRRKKELTPAEGWGWTAIATLMRFPLLSYRSNVHDPGYVAPGGAVVEIDSSTGP
jgi:hypothetical protein